VTIKEIEDTIQRLIHKDVLYQGLDRAPSGYPHIFLSFVKDSGEEMSDK
jgi:hypothetical protein